MAGQCNAIHAEPSPEAEPIKNCRRDALFLFMLMCGTQKCRRITLHIPPGASGFSNFVAVGTSRLILDATMTDANGVIAQIPR